MEQGPALLVIHKNKAFDCCLKLNKINFVLLEQYTNKQTNKQTTSINALNFVYMTES